jgi:hypothetical protein
MTSLARREVDELKKFQNFPVSDKIKIFRRSRSRIFGENAFFEFLQQNFSIFLNFNFLDQKSVDQNVSVPQKSFSSTQAIKCQQVDRES